MSEPIVAASASTAESVRAQPIIKNCKSPAQLAMLAQARVKALAIRQQNAALRAKEREIQNVEDVKRKIEIESKHAELYSVPTSVNFIPARATQEQRESHEQRESNPREEEVKIKKSKKKVVVISDSESDDEYTTIRVKKTKLQKWQSKPQAPVVPVPVPIPVQIIPKKKNPLFSI